MPGRKRKDQLLHCKKSLDGFKVTLRFNRFKLWNKTFSKVIPQGNDNISIQQPGNLLILPRRRLFASPDGKLTRNMFFPPPMRYLLRNIISQLVSIRKSFNIKIHKIISMFYLIKISQKMPWVSGTSHLLAWSSPHLPGSKIGELEERNMSILIRIILVLSRLHH